MLFGLVTLLVLGAPPRGHTLTGLDKPKKEQKATLGESETTKGKVSLRCREVGEVVIYEVNDPGLIGARDLWLEKKGATTPPCDANERSGRVQLHGAEGFGYVAGSKGDFLFVTSADGFGEKQSLRVFSLSSGNQLFETEYSSQQPLTLTVEGKSVWLRFHQSVVVTCEPHGETAEACWKDIREAARVPESVEIKPPPCDAIFKGKSHLAGTSQVSLPAEVDLSNPKVVKFRPGAATCAEAP